MIRTDSQSLCMALGNHNSETEGIRYNLQDHTGKISTQWIPGHADVPGNDMADEAARDDSGLVQDTRPLSYKCACMMSNHTFKDETVRPGIQNTYSKYDKAREREITTREE